MQESTTREKVLKKIRNALINKTSAPFANVDLDSRIYSTNDEANEIVFAARLIEEGGHFIFCENKFDFAEHFITLAEEKKWNQIVCPDEKIGAFLKQVEFPFTPAFVDAGATEVAVTCCECLVARTGSILISSRQAHGRRLPSIARVHVIVAYSDQLVDDLKDALQLMKITYNGKLPSLLTFISGPSKTADIELIQVTGVHGPEEIYVFLIDDSEPV